MRFIARLVIISLALGSAARAGEIDFLEDFALGDDRQKAVDQLIPGTEDHYYYLCLHLENTGQLGKVDEVLAHWIKRYGYTARVEEIRNRQALLKYEKEPRSSLDFLRERMGLNFDHQREVAGQKTDFPTRLDGSLYEWRALEKRALSSYGDLSGFEASALDAIPSGDLDGDHRRALLARLERPDYPDLARLVVEDLGRQYAQPFGGHPIHERLLLSQLDECLALMPQLREEAAFVRAYVTKLRPGADADWRHDERLREEYLDRLWAFVTTLSPAHNSLKAHVLYYRLVHDRAKGLYDPARFLEYLAIPRPAHYANQDYVQKRARASEQMAQLGENFESVTGFAPIANDEPLVRDFLMTLLRGADSFKAYSKYVADGYLKEVFAETKILAGIGDMERWTSLLGDPGRYQALKERVDIEFAPGSKTFFSADEPVSLDVDVKNVRTLIVKVFEIDTTSYYREKLQEIDAAVDLDGLVPNEERTFTYDEPALRRVRRRLDFPNLARRGVFAIELIGNGKSSRALVRKGQLRFAERASAAGQVFRIFDESNRKVSDATIALAGHEYRADADGTILVPYSAAPGTQPIVITHQGFSTLERFQHLSESYRLHAGIYVDRESLLRRRKARAILRPLLELDGAPVALSLLEMPSLVIQATDISGVPSSKEASGLTLTSDRELVYEFQVPDDLKDLRFTLKGKVKSLLTGQRVDLSDEASFSLNGIDSTERVEDLHLARAGAGYVLELLGKNGEAKRDRALTLSLKHRDFTQTVDTVVQTDERGRVDLGALEGLVSVRATAPDGTSHSWRLDRDRHSYPGSIHARAGETVSVPYMGKAPEPGRAFFSLLEVRGGSYAIDWSKALALSEGFLEVRGLPPGSFRLFLKEEQRALDLEVAQGEAQDGILLGATRMLEPRRRPPLQIAAVEADAGYVRVRVKNGSAATRVHVVATRFLPAYSIYDGLARASQEPGLKGLSRDESFFVSGRDIGDEYRYILERRYAQKYPGNMAARPSLLLNPWSLRKTETDTYGGGGSGRYGGRFGAKRSMVARGGGEAAAKLAQDDAPYANLDFLPEPAAMLVNLSPDEGGVVSIARKDLGAAQDIHVVAVDLAETVYRDLALPAHEAPPRDVRLRDGLDPAKHFAEQKAISLLEKDGSLTVKDLTTSKVEVYDTLRRAYGLFATLTHDATLAEFAFVLDWPKLSPAEKRERYSKYACHELSFFLYRKDRAFFDAVVLPYLANKRDKTFLDRWLLDEKLDSYLAPWAYARLNVFERILLAQKIPGEPAHMQRHVQDLFDLVPPNQEERHRLFMTAIAGSALETADALGIGNATEHAEAEKLAKLKASGEWAKSSAGATAAPDRAGADKTAEPEAPRPPSPSPATGAAPPAPPGGPADGTYEKRTRRRDGDDEDRKALADEERDVTLRQTVRQLYRALDKTEEWAENNYYHVPIESQNGDLVTVNGFWADWAVHPDGAPFLSQSFPEAHRSFTEMLLALAVLDLPFEAGAHATAFDGPRMTLTARSPSVVFRKEIEESAAAKEAAPVLVSQNFFRRSDRYRFERGERFDKYVSEEFLTGVPYGCQVVLTNPTSSRRKLEVLLQIPRGAVPVLNGFFTRGLDIELEPYATTTFEYSFYFPAAGTFAHYPIHVSHDGALVAFAAPTSMRVVETPTKVDTTSWDFVSQDAAPEDVLQFLEKENLGRLDLGRIAWRMHDRGFFMKTLELLARRHVYADTLWSYGIYHGEAAAVREYLKHAEAFVSNVGAAIDCALLALDPVERGTYQHLEYSPLVNARAHTLGKRRTILNQRLLDQYHGLLKVLSYRAALSDEDRLAVAYYLLLQDRVEEGMRFFDRIDRSRITERLQADYMQAYLDLYTPEHKLAREIAARYHDHPVDRWRKLFQDIAAKLDEAEGKQPTAVDEESRDARQGALAATEATFDFTVEGKRVNVAYQNLGECRVNYYLMDIELLFSKSPFVEHRGGQFSFVKPNRSEVVKFPEGRSAFAFDMPPEYANQNLMVELVGGGARKQAPCFSNALALKLVENYGQLRLTRQGSGAPLPKVYVKVYAHGRDGAVRFYKDGYTDLRGVFDYTSLSTSELDSVDRFSLLVLSETDGALIREVAPPKR